MIREEFAAIAMTQGKWAIVDVADFYWLSAFNWHASNNHDKGWYAVTNIPFVHETRKQKLVRMHRMIMDVLDSSVVIDHKNHDGVDNRRGNFRLCTQSENMRNSRKMARASSSRYKGVTYHPGRTHVKNPWWARIRLNGRNVTLGHFGSEEAAAQAYNDAAEKYFGHFAHLNVIPEKDTA